MLEKGQEEDLIVVLQATIDTLQGQLEVKDRQIEQQSQSITRLSDALVAAQQTAAAAQAISSSSFLTSLGLISSTRSRSQKRSVVGLVGYWAFEVL